MTYTRVCPDCGDVATITYKPKPGTKCRVCSSRDTANSTILTRWKPGRKKKVYYYFCPSCSNIRVLSAKRKTPYCGDCNRIASKQPKIYIYFDLKDMKMRVPNRYFRICPMCPEDNNTKQVKQAAHAGIRPCRHHAQQLMSEEQKKLKEERRLKSLSKTLDSRPPKRKKPKKKYVSKQAIERAKKINQEHKAKLEELADEVTNIPKQTKTDKEMMDEWLKTNKPTIIETEIPESSKYSSGMKIKEF
jgi:hypothetical protein